MRLILLLVLIFGQQATPETLTPAFVEVANDAADALDRMASAHMEPRAVYATAKMEATKYMQKADRLRKTKPDNHVSLVLLQYSIQVDLCQTYFQSLHPDANDLKVCLKEESRMAKAARDSLKP